MPYKDHEKKKANDRKNSSDRRKELLKIKETDPEKYLELEEKRKSDLREYKKTDAYKLLRNNYKRTCVKRYLTIKAGAKQRGHNFDINYLTKECYQENFFQNTCLYCGDISTGIDRVDNTQGYVEGNCVPCCGECNYMKRLLSKVDFQKKIIKIYFHLLKEN